MESSVMFNYCGDSILLPHLTPKSKQGHDEANDDESTDPEEGL